MKQKYKIIRSGRKSVGIEVNTAGDVIVRAPYQVKADEIDAIVKSRETWIADTIKRQRSREVQARAAALTEEQIDGLYKAALEKLPPIVDKYAAAMNVMPVRVTVTAAEKRLGSCSAKKCLCFSYKLMLYPPQVIEYVVVHELAQLRYMNHGADFHASSSRYCRAPQVERQIRSLSVIASNIYRFCQFTGAAAAVATGYTVSQPLFDVNERLPPCRAVISK